MDITLLDGGMGQELVRRSSQPAHPQWGAWVMMNEPEIVQALHEEYLRAGARAEVGGHTVHAVGNEAVGHGMLS